MKTFSTILWAHDWSEYKDFWRWCISYTPKLLNTFYNPLLSEYEFKENREAFIDEQLERYHSYEARRIGGENLSLSQAVQNLSKWYSSKFSAPNLSYKEIEEEAENILTYMKFSEDDWRKRYKIPICTLSKVQILKLLLFCPISFVRNHLYEQCGYNPKWEKYYKFLFKGNNNYKIPL